MTPEPSHSIQIWCVRMPSAETKNPPLQQHAATTAAFRGPSRSTHAPKSAAEDPSITKNRVNIQPSVPDVRQQSSGAGLVDAGSRGQRQPNTLKPAAMPRIRNRECRRGRHQPAVEPGPARCGLLERKSVKRVTRRGWV
jgi:hypothetical protein